jgi:hypothetical protein
MSENENNAAGGRAADWANRIDQVRSFAQTNNRWPSTTAKDESELKLAQWWSRQKYYFKKFEKGEKSPGINDDRAQIIRDLISDFAAFERDGIWIGRYNIVKSRIQTAQKLWPYDTENDEEKRVLRWWNQQKTFYRKFRKGTKAGGMTERRAQLVEQLLGLLGQPLITNDGDDDTQATDASSPSQATDTPVPTPDPAPTHLGASDFGD